MDIDIMVFDVALCSFVVPLTFGVECKGGYPHVDI
mgnify:CR=1 FL=1